MVLYGVSTNTSIKDLFISGIFPGILLGLAFILTNFIFAYKENYVKDTSLSVSHIFTAFLQAFLPLVIPGSVILMLIFGIITPTEAAATGVALCTIFMAITNKNVMQKLRSAISNTVRQTSVVMMIIAGSSILGQFLANEQIPQMIAQSLLSFSENPVVLILLINVFLLFLGMVLHASAAIIIIVPILLPIATQIGIDPVHFGIIVCLNLGIGQQTPPVASVLLTVCSAVDIGVKEVMKYSKWYILTMFVVLMIVTFVPHLSIWFKL